MTKPEYGPLFLDHEARNPLIIAVTDLGPGNRGHISATDLSRSEKEELVLDIQDPKYYKQPTNRFRCVDGRTVAGGLQTPPGLSDPQIAGGIAISETACGMMVEKNTPEPLSEQLASKTRMAIIGGIIVVVHGDSGHQKEGCGANVKIREAIGLMADNHDLIIDKVWPLAEQLGIARYAQPRDATQLIVNGERNTEDDSLWDVTPGEAVGIAVENGAEYEEVIDDHREKAIIADTTEMAFNEEDFMRDHIGADGKSMEAFVASLGVYSRWRFENARRQGQQPRDAALGILGVVLFNIAVPKVLTAEETGKGEALPVVILGY